MAKDRVLVFQPNDIAKYAKTKNGPDEFLEQILHNYREEFVGQFRSFPYVSCQRNGNICNYAGFMYRREGLDDRDPLSYLPGADLVEGIQKIASGLNADAIHLGLFSGRIEVADPTSRQMKNILDLSLGSEHKDYGLNEPRIVKRFFLNLNNRLFENIIMPRLETLGFASNTDFYKVG